jgi:hypothetical protein
MYLTAQSAMRKRRRITSPTCSVEILQQPDLGRLGRFTGSRRVTLGAFGTLVDSAQASVPTVGGISPWVTIAALGAIALVAGFMLRPKVLRARRKVVDSATGGVSLWKAAAGAAGAGVIGYFAGRSAG